MRRLLLIFGLLLCAVGASAQTTTFNGVIKDLTSTPVPTGQVTFQLKPGIDTTISGSSRFVPATTFCEIHNPGVVSTSGTGTITVVVDTAQNWLVGDSLIFVGTPDATLNASSVASPYAITTRNSSTSFVFTQSGAHTNGAGGTVGGLYKSGGTGACAVMQNTAITPANTSYTVAIQAIFSPSSAFNAYAIGSGPVDISTVVPTPSQMPAYSFADTFSSQTIGGNKSFTGAPGITESNIGIFNNTQMNEYLQSLINGCSPQTEFQFVQGGSKYSTDALSGCISVPNTSTKWQAVAVAGYANNSSATNTAGGYFSGHCKANGSNCWGGDSVAIDDVGLTTNVQLFSWEADTQPQNAETAYGGSGAPLLTGVDSLLFAPVAGNYGAAFKAGSAQVGLWQIAYRCVAGQINAACLAAEKQLTAGASKSQSVTFNANTGGGDIQSLFYLDSDSAQTMQLPFNGGFKFAAGSDGFMAKFSHTALSALRTYTLDDASGHIPSLPTAAITETGSGAIVRTTSPTITSPTFGTGVAADGSGHKHKRFGGVLGGTCPTAAAIGAACTSGNLNWTTGFADNNYTVVCTLNGSMTGQPHIVSTAYQAAGAGITLTIAADTAAATNVAAAGFVDCTADHD